MEEERRNHCNSHSCTMDEIKHLKEENQKIRRELNEVKEAIKDFKKFETHVIERYNKKQNSFLNRIARALHLTKEEDTE